MSRCSSRDRSLPAPIPIPKRNRSPPPQLTPTSRRLFPAKPQTNNQVILINIPKKAGFQPVPALLRGWDEAGAIPPGGSGPRGCSGRDLEPGGTRGPPRWEQLAANPAGRAGGGAGGGDPKIWQTASDGAGRETGS
ncbi:hypothetical protein DV515_00017152 [Chloebia gouldiae]|uniref:Uncharacterized protein n=1 Tax=Chloebia gouldiae TaxID=44316 RepID=A0A3L8R0U2_CHLGU|nr:hypothetical protein DV515_00017152 [Chloebia gouldiae]